MMPKRSYLWLFMTLALVGLCVDLASKYVVFRWLYNDHKSESQGKFESWRFGEPWHPEDSNYIGGGRYNLIPGWFGFTAEYLPEDLPESRPCDCVVSGLQTWSAPTMPRVNYGALFGMGGDHKSAANKVFASVSLAAALGILTWVLLRGRQLDGWMLAALGLILGGTLGNFYDRVLFNGVRDFLYFYKIRWPVFNIADCCLVCGAIMLLIHAFLFAPPDTQKNETPALKSETPPASPSPTPPSA